MIRTFYLFIFFCNVSLFAAQPNIGSIKKLQGGLYTAEGTTADGEKIYFGYERLDTQAERDAWQGYSDACQKLVADPNGWLVELGTHAKRSDYKKCKKRDHFKYMAAPAYRQLARYLRKGGFTPEGKKWENLHAIRHGMAGFGPQFANYVAYISTKPITERIRETESVGTYTEVELQYGHIIMTVCSTVSTEKKPIYENGGIFRNPIHLIKGGYYNVSCMLHVFTAKVMRGITMQYLTMRPLPVMKDILVKTLGNDKVKIGDEIPEPLRDFPALGFGFNDINMLINLDDIATLYNASRSEKKQKSDHKKSQKSKKKK